MRLSPLPPYRKIAAAAGVTAFAVTLAAGFLLFDWQKDRLRADRVQTGRILLEGFAESAAIPLLGDDLLSLNLLVRQASRLDGTVFVAIADSGKTIRAHSDPATPIRRRRGRLSGIPRKTVHLPRGPPS
ncbi:MAG: hypothetical protein H6Q81_1187 [Deltaproteobacteria bacterium]|nr:hypothetical protein [Deltaproteobacteria bacterium]